VTGAPYFFGAWFVVLQISLETFFLVLSVETPSAVHCLV
jgi:hypothetical protein